MICIQEQTHFVDFLSLGRNFVDRNFRDIVGNNNLTAQEKLNQSRKTLLDSINDFQGVDNFSGAASRLTDKINSVESIVEIPEIISDLENSLESSITRDLKNGFVRKDWKSSWCIWPIFS